MAPVKIEARAGLRQRRCAAEVRLRFLPGLVAGQPPGGPCVEVTLLEVDASVATGDASLSRRVGESSPGESQVTRRDQSRLELRAAGGESS